MTFIAAAAAESGLIDALLGDRAFYFSSVLVLGIIAQWLAWRFKMPSILILLIFGFIAGRFFDADALIGNDLIFPVVSLAVAVILFEGGLSLKLSELKEAGGPVLRLCTVGVLIAWGLTAGLGRMIGLSWQVSALLGGILVVTGPTVVAPLLRIVKPSRKVASMVKWEGIVVDPIGALLALLVFQTCIATSANHAFSAIALSLIKTLVIGIGLALILAKGLEIILKKHWLPDFLHGVAFLAVGTGAFTLSNLLQHESGLLTVTILGIALANQKSVSVHHVIEFKENLRVLLISALFIVLAGRVAPSDMMALGWKAPIFILGLILVVRPVSVMLSTIKSGATLQERIFLSFLAPRGIVAAAVTAIFALELIHAAEGGLLPERFIEEAGMMVPLTFSVIVGTVAFYGIFAAPLAKMLGIAAANPQGILFVGARDWVIRTAELLQKEGCNVLIVDTNHQRIAEARMAGIPTCRTNILSDYAEEELDIAGLGNLLAVTPNEEVNTLAANEYRQIFGSGNVFQLRRAERPHQHERVTISHHRRGRPLFSGEPTYGELVQRENAEWPIKSINITEAFTSQDLNSLYKGKLTTLFIIRASKAVVVCTPETDPPTAGDTVIAMVPPDDAPVVKEGKD